MSRSTVSFLQILQLLRQHPVIAVSATLLVALILWGFLPQAALVETVAVKRGPMAVTIEEEGRTRVIDRYVIAAPVNGVACRVSLNVGDRVTQDQVLLAITPLASPVLDARSRAQANAKIAAAESALQAAKEQASAAAAAAEQASNELQRLQPLAKKDLVSKEMLDRATTEVKATVATKRSADFNVEVAEYDLESARTTLQYSGATAADLAAEHVPVRSPINGKILKVYHECEGPVQTGEPLFEVGDPSALEIEVDVLSADAVKIQPDMTVLFERWGGEKALQGAVRTVEPVGFTKISALGVEEQRVLIISDFTSPKEQWQRLGDGYRVEARFILWRGDDILQVPSSSLFRYQDGWALFVAAGNHAHRRLVTVGERNGLSAQIIDGVDEGESVINHPNDTIEDSTRIEPRRE